MRKYHDMGSVLRLFSKSGPLTRSKRALLWTKERVDTAAGIVAFYAMLLSLCVGALFFIAHIVAMDPRWSLPVHGSIVSMQKGSMETLGNAFMFYWMLVLAWYAFRAAIQRIYAEPSEKPLNT